MSTPTAIAAPQAKTSWLVERHSIEPIPPDERYDKVYRQFTMWAAMNMTPQTLAAGAFGISMGLPVWACCAAIIIGSGIGGILCALHGEQGPALGLTQMIQSRAQFGFFGAGVITFLLTVPGIVWDTFFAIMISQSLQALFGWPPLMGLVVAFGLAGVVAVLGYKGIHLTNTIITVLMSILVIMVAFRVIPEVAAGAGDYVGTFTWAAFMAVVIFEVSGQLSNAGGISDMTRYLPADAGRKAIFIAVFVGGTGSAIIVTMLGALTASLNFEAVNENILGYLGSLFPAIAAPLTIILTFCMIFIIASGFYGNHNNYMTVFSSRGAGSASGPLTRGIYVVIDCAVVSYLALNVQEDFINKVGGLVSLSALLMIPWSAINLADYYIVHRGRHYDIEGIVDKNGIYGKWNLPALTTFSTGVLVQIPFVVSEWPEWQGPGAQLLGGLNFTWLIGFVFSAVMYVVWSRVQPDKVSPDLRYVPLDA